MRKEPGTGIWVCRSCDDRSFNLRDHPQNRPPPFSPDPQALSFVSPLEVIITSVSWTPRDTIYYNVSTTADVPVSVSVSASVSAEFIFEQLRAVNVGFGLVIY
jgi:hypothetical protein